MTDSNNRKEITIEDTAKLLVASKNNTLKRALPLIVIVLIAVLAAAGLFGYKKISDKRYNDQISIAEKALREGDYEQAETGYLEAVSMNKRRIEAHKGLALAYVAEEKFKEASEEYMVIYEQTNEEVYKETADTVASGQIPMDGAVFPNENIWIRISTAAIPNYDQLIQFMDLYTTFYEFVYTFDKDSRRFEDFQFDNEHPGDSYAIQVMQDLIHSGYIPNRDNMTIDESETDPKGWAAGLTHRKIESQFFEDSFRKVFNISEDKMEEAVASAVKKRDAYRDGGYYYFVFANTEYIPLGVDIKDMWINGSKVCIQYDLSTAPMNEGPFGTFGKEYIGTYYMTCELNEFEGRPIWTIYNNNAVSPDFLAENRSA